MASKFVKGREAITWLDGIISRWSTQQLSIVSPFITKSGMAAISTAMSQHEMRKAIVLTCLDCPAIAMGYLDVCELAALITQYGDRFQVYHIPKLHAKVFLLEGIEALVGSANLTMGGMSDNVEIGIRCSSKAEIEELDGLILHWRGTREPVERDQLLAYYEYAKTHYMQLLQAYRHVVAFPHQEHTYDKVVRDALQQIPARGGIEKSKFVNSIRNQRTQVLADKDGPENRLWFLQQLKLVRIKDNKVYKADNVRKVMKEGTRQSNAFAMLICSEFPECLQILDALLKYGKETGWEDVPRILDNQGIGHLVDQHKSIIRWMVHLNQISLISGEPKRIESFKVKSSCYVLRRASDTYAAQIIQNTGSTDRGFERLTGAAL
ncbi:MAG: phospholipase D-like domain-containing protein [Chthonomonadales bacterium]